MVEILEPLEVGAGDTTSIDEHVRSALDSSALEDFLGCKGSWAVSTLKYGLHLDLLSVAIVERLLNGGRDHAVGLLQEERLGAINDDFSGMGVGCK